MGILDAPSPLPAARALGWKIVTDPPYGAKGDGSTDDSAAIQAAINAAAAAGGGRVFFPSGTYRIGTFVRLKTNVSLVGSNRTTTILKARAGLTIGVLVATSGDAVTDASIEDLTVDGDYSASALAINGIQVTTGTRVKVHRSAVRDVGGNGIIFQTNSAECEVVNCDIRTTGRANAQTGFGVLFSAASRCTVSGSQFYNCNGMTVGGNTNALDCIVIGNYMEKAGCPLTTAVGAQSIPAGSITVASTAGFPPVGTLDVDGCGIVLYTGKTATTFTGCTGGSGTLADGGVVQNGYEHIGFTAGCTGWLVSSNKVMNSRDNGISASAAEAMVIGNVVDNALYHGILAGGNNSVVCGNYVRNAASAGTAGLAFIFVDSATRSVITGNRGIDDRGASAKTQFGVKESGPTSFVTYIGNAFSGQTVRTYNLLSNSNPIVQPLGVSTMTYAAAMTPDPTTSIKKKIVVTDGNPFTFSAPINPFPGGLLVLDIVNSSGGAMGTITWNAVYKMAGAFTNPASTKRRTISFMYDGTDWVETARNAADI